MSRRKNFMVTEAISDTVIASATDNLLGKPAIIIGQDSAAIVLSADAAIRLWQFIGRELRLPEASA